MGQSERGKIPAKVGTTRGVGRSKVGTGRLALLPLLHDTVTGKNTYTGVSSDESGS